MCCVSSIQEEVDALLDFIDREARGRFDDVLSAASMASWKFKPWLPIWRAYSSTVGNTIYLSKEDWQPLDQISKCALVIHEATHVIQWKHLGRLAFIARYAQPAGRYKLELDAFGQELWWWCRANHIADPDKNSNPREYVAGNMIVAKFFQNIKLDYWMSGYVSARYDDYIDYCLARVRAYYIRQS